VIKRLAVSLAKLAGFIIVLAVASWLAFWLTIRAATEEKEIVTVPDLRALDTRTALERVNSVGLRLVIQDDAKSQYDASVPRNHVLRQDPPPGTRLKADRRVSVVLSLGPHDRYVPNVVGEAVSEAQLRLHESGLTVGDLVYVSSARVAENAVIAQEPTSVAEASDGIVDLLVSSGQSERVWVMPDLIGRGVTRIEAYLQLRQLRVKIEYEDYTGMPQGTIIRQKPRAGHPLRGRDVVWLWVASGRRSL